MPVSPFNPVAPAVPVSPLNDVVLRTSEYPDGQLLEATLIADEKLNLFFETDWDFFAHRTSALALIVQRQVRMMSGKIYLCVIAASKIYDPYPDHKLLRPSTYKTLASETSQQIKYIHYFNKIATFSKIHIWKMIHIWIADRFNLASLMKLRKRLAKKLKEIMKERGETQAQFSKRIGVGQATLNRVLNGEQSISIDRLESICNSLRLDIKDLFPEFKKD